MKQMPTLTDDQVRRVRMLHASRQMGYSKLAKLFSSSDTTIRNVVLRLTYKHVADDPNPPDAPAPRAPDPAILSYRAAVAVRAERAAARHAAAMEDARRAYARGTSGLAGMGNG